MDRAYNLPEPVDARLFFRAYAVLALAGGFVIASWGQIWLGSHLPGLPWGKAALVRVFGTVVMAAGCWAASLARVEDRAVLRAGLFWFAVGHSVVALMVVLQRIAIWGEGTAATAGQLLVTFGCCLWLLWIESVARGSVLTSLFGGAPPASTEGLRSRYEQQIRGAAQQEERHRLARDLHDSVKQQIFVIQTAAATAQARFDDDRAGAAQALDQIRASAREAAAEMQAMLDQLRAEPLENTGLVEAIRKQCEALGFRTGAHVELQLGELPANEALEPGVHESLLRVVQEALANVGRHARAANVQVSLGALHDRLRLRIADDGSGFDPNTAPRGLGLANMRDRADEFGGVFEVSSRPGGGTWVEFSVPALVMAGRPHYLRNAVLWGALLTAPPAVYLAVGHWAVPGSSMVCVIAAFGLLRNLSAHNRLRERRAR